MKNDEEIIKREIIIDEDNAFYEMDIDCVKKREGCEDEQVIEKIKKDI